MRVVSVCISRGNGVRCAIYYKAGDCVVPKEGVFARVVREGVVRTCDAVTVLARRIPGLPMDQA